MPTGAGAPNCVAVQKTGNLLAVSQIGLNQIILFDKLTGLPIPGAFGLISTPSPLTIRWSPDGKTLWSTSGNDVTGWQLNGSAWAPVSVLHGTSEVKSIAVNPADGSVAILYGGTDQQVRAYTPGGTWLYTVGAHGGYASGPAVNDTKFQVAPLAKSNTGGIGFQDDGKLWILDDGDQRVLRFPVHRHLAAARKDAVVCMLNGYMLAVDPNNPDRMVAEGYLEFRRDYTKPLSAGIGEAWTLVNNWGYGYKGWGGTTNSKDGMIAITTATNGHTYGVFWPSSFPYPHMVDLRDSGLQDLGSLQREFEQLDKNMQNLWYCRIPTPQHARDDRSEVGVYRVRCQQPPYVGAGSGVRLHAQYARAAFL